MNTRDYRVKAEGHYKKACYIKSRLIYLTTLGGLPELSPDGGPYHIETSSLIFSANIWAGFYMKGNSAMKELKHKKNGFGFSDSINGLFGV